MKPILVTIDIVEVFEFQDGRTVNITALRKHLEDSKAEIKPSGMPLENVREMLGKHAFGPDKFKRMIDVLRKVAADKCIPPLIVLTPEEHVTAMHVDLIDGWHTLAVMHSKAEELAVPIVNFPAYWVKPSHLNAFIIPAERITKAGNK